MNPFEEFPDELVLAIFRHIPQMELPRCAMVCSRWRNLVSDHSLWTRVTIDKNIPFEALATILQRDVLELQVDPEVEILSTIGSFPADLKLPLRVLDFNVGQFFYPLPKSRHDTLSRILPCTSQLVELRIREAILREEHLESIACNPNLQVLDLYCCDFPESLLPDILQRCKGLRELTVTFARLDDRAVLEGLIANLHSTITALDLTAATRTCLLDADLPKILEKCPNLTRLDVSYNNGLTTEGVAAVAKLNPKIELIFGDLVMTAGMTRDRLEI